MDSKKPFYVVLLDRIGLCIPLAFVATAISAAASGLGMFDRLELNISDAASGITETLPSGKVAIVGIDRASIDHYGALPIPRSAVAQALDNLRLSGAERVYVDYTYTADSGEVQDAPLERALRELGNNRVAIPYSPSKDIIDRFAKNATIVASDAVMAHDNRARSLTCQLLTEDSPLTNGDQHKARRKRRIVAGHWLAMSPSTDPALIVVGMDPRKIYQISFLDLLDGPVADLKGRRVVLGITAKEFVPHLSIPIYEGVSRPEFIALAAESAIVRPNPFHVPGHIIPLLALSVGILVSGLVRRRAIVGGAIVTVVAAICLFCVDSLMIRQLGGGIPVAYCASTALLSAVGTMIATLPQFRSTRMALRSMLEKVDIRLAQLFDSGVDAIITFSPEGRVLTVNQAAENLLGRTAESVIGQRLDDVLPEGGSELLRAAAERQPGRMEMQVDSEKDTRHVDLTFNAIPSDSTWVGFASLRDITDFKSREEELKRQTMHDAMTGLPNRVAHDRHLDATIRFARETNQTFALFLMDLNRFKQVNDTLGHHIGDALLIECGRRFTETVRKSDLVARLGGDEFTVVLSAPTDEALAKQIAERMVRSIAELSEIDEQTVDTGTSIGIALFPDHGSTAEELTCAADAAMYEAKRAGDGYKLAELEEVASHA